MSVQMRAIVPTITTLPSRITTLTKYGSIGVPTGWPTMHNYAAFQKVKFQRTPPLPTVVRQLAQPSAELDFPRCPRSIVVWS